MEDDQDKGIGAPVVMGLATAGALGAALYITVPHIHQALAHTVPASRLFGDAALSGLAIGLAAGTIGWLVAAAVTRSALLPKGPVFVLLLAAGLAAVSVSTAGWIQTVTSVNRAFGGRSLFRPINRLGMLPLYRQQMARDKEAYQREMRALGYPRFLAPAEIATPEGKEEAHSKIILARAVVSRYRALYSVRLANLKDSLVQSSGPRSESAKRLDAAIQPEATARLAWWDAVDAIIAEQQATVNDLTLTKAPWKAKDGKFVFRAKSDAETFEAHVATLKILQEKAHTLDLAIAHASDKTDETMVGMKG